MADLLIRGMTIPPKGKYLHLRIDADGKISGQINKNAYFCSLADVEEKAVEVPDHGPLGDLDVLYNAVEQRYKLSSGIEHRCERDLLDLICNSDTIIPASPADRSDTPDDSPQIQIVADALKHGFYGTMYGEKYAQGVKLVFIEPGKAWASNGDLFFRWGFPGPDMNTYKPEDYGKTWALTEAELTESIQSDPANKEGGA